MKRRNNKTLMTIALVAILASVAGILIGFSLKAAPAAVPAGDGNVTIPEHEEHIHVYDMSTNGIIVNVTKDTEFQISLPEDGGSTGYLWNITSTQGLDILGSGFIPGKKGLPGEPGIRQWAVRASWSGEQKFKATLLRSFEAPAGNESVYLLTLNVT